MESGSHQCETNVRNSEVVFVKFNLLLIKLLTGYFLLPLRGPRLAALIRIQRPSIVFLRFRHGLRLRDFLFGTSLNKVWIAH